MEIGPVIRIIEAPAPVETPEPEPVEVPERVEEEVTA